MQDFTNLPKLSIFNSLQYIVPMIMALIQLPNMFSELVVITPMQIFNLIHTNCNMRQLVANSNCHANQQWENILSMWLCIWYCSLIADTSSRRQFADLKWSMALVNT